MQEKKELWTVVADFKGGTYISQFEVSSVHELIPRIIAHKEGAYRHFNHFEDFDVWVPVEGTTSVFCNGGTSNENDEDFLLHAVLTEPSTPVAGKNRSSCGPENAPKESR